MLKVVVLLMFLAVLQVSVAPPVQDSKKKDKEKSGEAEDNDHYNLEYGRYLQQVVQALEEDKEFAKKLENVTADQIRSGHVAIELEFVKHNVRTKLDELKRIEVDRLRKLVQEQMERTELGLYRDEEGRLLSAPDGRQWRTIPGHVRGSEGGVGDGDFWLGLNRKGIKLPQHVDIENPHSFEISDLKKLIQTATSDLEALDQQRRDEFKKYEIEKEAQYRESLKNMTDVEKKETEKHHQELIEKHKDHPKVHHPGSKPQLEQVWEEQDHMPKEEFNPKTFFAMHDINGDGHLDVEEVEAILVPEVRKVYNPNNEEDDPAEMMEEFHRMREHIFNETDKNKDSLISLDEFLKMTEQQDFQQDDGWRGLDEQSVYSEAEIEEYMRQRQMEMQRNPAYYGGDPRMYYDHPNAPPQGMPPNIQYQGHPNAMPPNAGYQQGHPQQYQQPPQYQVHPQQQYQGHPQQFQGHPQQAQFQGHPPQPQYQQQPQFQGQQQHVQFQGQPQQPQYQGQPQQVPVQGQPQQVPVQGQPQQVPVQGQPQQVPVQGQPQQVPVQGQPQHVPVQGQPQHVPVQGQPQQVPVQGQPQHVPVQGQPQQVNIDHQNKQPIQTANEVVKEAPHNAKPIVPEKKEAISSDNQETVKKQA